MGTFAKPARDSSERTPSAPHSTSRGIVQQQLLIRLSQRRDAAAMRSFACASGEWYEREVETYIQTIIAPQIEQGRRVLLVEDGDEIVAVAAHREANDPGGTGLVVSWLELEILSRVVDRCEVITRRSSGLRAQL